jgi:hypothetical protein
MGIPQGDLKLLDAELDTRLLHSKTPARLAYIAKDGTARVILLGFIGVGASLSRPHSLPDRVTLWGERLEHIR